MRILLANDGFADAGGVQNYLDAVVGSLLARGHRVAVIHRDPIANGGDASVLAALPQFSVASAGVDAAIAAARAWQPDVCYSHNMNVLDVDRRLIAAMPVIKFMHGYFGTCVSGLKRHAWPTPRPCDRPFGPACAALFLPRRCGRASIRVLGAQYRWTAAQHDLLPSYRAIVVASDHMRREYVNNGVDAGRVHVVPLFPTCEPVAAPAAPTEEPSVAFLARMTPLKGGALLVRAVGIALAQLHTRITLTMVGDGPERPQCEAVARHHGVDCAFVGWQPGPERFDAVRRAHLVAVPSVWPEPFGLVGLEAAAFGVPAIAFDVGGIAQWLRPGVNGILVEADPPRAETFADALVSAFRDRAQLAAMRPKALAVAREMSLARHVDRVEQLLRECSSTAASDGVGREARWARG